MARKKVKSKTRKVARKRTGINVRRKKPYKAKRTVRRSPAFGFVDKWNDFLDQTVSVRNLLKYTGIVLLFFLVVGSSFMLGRITTGSSDPGDSSDAPKISSSAVEEFDTGEVVNDSEKKELSEPAASLETVEEPDVDPVDDDQDVVYRAATDEDVVKEQYFESEPVEPEPEPVQLSVAEFGYEYSKVKLDVTDIEKLERGTNWASVESLKLTIENGEESTIINPTRVKIKINSKGKGSNWWDDELFLPESFKNMKPGEVRSDTIKVHVSFSDIYSEKDFQLVVLDDYDVPIAWYKKILVIK